jgi:hypothetical protein
MPYGHLATSFPSSPTVWVTKKRRLIPQVRSGPVAGFWHPTGRRPGRARGPRPHRGRRPSSAVIALRDQASRRVIASIGSNCAPAKRATDTRRAASITVGLALYCFPSMVPGMSGRLVRAAPPPSHAAGSCWKFCGAASRQKGSDAANLGCRGTSVPSTCARQAQIVVSTMVPMASSGSIASDRAARLRPRMIPIATATMTTTTPSCTYRRYRSGGR